MTETFQPPDISHLTPEAHYYLWAGEGIIHRMTQALQTQLSSGPLADLQAGSVDGPGFVQEVSSLVSSYQLSADLLLSPRFPNIDNIVKLQGAKIQAEVTALDQQATVGLLTSSDLATSAQADIDSLTGGPLRPLHTPLSAYVQVTQSFESSLNTLASSLSTGATPSLTLTQVGTTLNSEADAYKAEMDASLYTHKIVNQTVDLAVVNLQTTVASIVAANPTDAQAQIQAAIAAFDTTVLDTTGVFGPQGVVARHTHSNHHNDSDD